jgi:hypothetical protein
MISGGRSITDAIMPGSPHIAKVIAGHRDISVTLGR